MIHLPASGDISHREAEAFLDAVDDPNPIHRGPDGVVPGGLLVARTLGVMKPLSQGQQPDRLQVSFREAGRYGSPTRIHAEGRTTGVHGSAVQGGEKLLDIRVTTRANEGRARANPVPWAAKALEAACVEPWVQAPYPLEALCGWIAGALVRRSEPGGLLLRLDLRVQDLWAAGNLHVQFVPPEQIQGSVLRIRYAITAAGRSLVAGSLVVLPPGAAAEVLQRQGL